MKQIRDLLKQSETQRSPAISQQNSQVLELRQRFKDSERLLTAYNPSLQQLCEENHDRCFIGSAPRLKQVSKAYGRDTAEMWLEIQLNDLSEFSGARDKLTLQQIQEIASVIIGNFSHLNLAEMMLFFRQFKAGRYGKFFGSVDGLAITSALSEFESYRECQLTRIRKQMERDKLEREREEHRRTAISYDEFCKQTNQKPQETIKNLYNT